MANMDFRITSYNVCYTKLLRAAFHSKAKSSAQVPVDYTLVKNVKKPNGAKPGMVIFVNNKTAFVTPDTEIIEKLKVK